jgi:hypothetical protein
MGMKWKPIHIVFVSAFFVSAIGLRLWPAAAPEGSVEVVLAGNRLHVLVADTPMARYTGLGGRASLAPYDGMLFPFPGAPARHGIVMRGMQFSIDAVWLKDGVVVDIAPSLPLEPDVPEGELTPYYPRDKANAVLELPAGWAKAHQLKIGDSLLTGGRE